jgi:hypothetical protein
MPASKYNFSIEKGTSFKFALTHKEQDGTIIDLSNWCARLVWITDEGVTQTFLTTNTDYSVYKFTLDGPNGKLLLLLPANTTNSFYFQNAKYDLELQSPDDLYAGGGKYTIRLLSGAITIVPRNSESDSPFSCAT